MSGTLNKVMLIGNLGDEVKMHYFENGDCIGRFPIATSETYTSKKTGERTTTTEWHNIVVRNKAAEICEKYLGKGDKVYVEGRLRTRQWQGDDGIDRYSTEVQAQDFTFLTPKGMSSSNSQEGGQSGGSQKAQVQDTTQNGRTEKGKSQGGQSERQNDDQENSDMAKRTQSKSPNKAKETAPLGQSEEDDLPF